MKLEYFTSHKLRIIIAIIILIIIFYFIIQYYIFHSDLLIGFLLSGINSYLIFIEKISNHLLIWAGSDIIIDNHSILLKNETLYVIESGVLLKRWFVILSLLFWFTKTSIKQKILFTVILILSGFIASAFTITIAAYLLESHYDTNSAYNIARTLGVLIMIFICNIWINTHKVFILCTLSKLKLNTDFINSKISRIFLVMYIYAFASNFILGYLDFSLWINLLFNAAKGILAILGEKAIVEPYYLIGNNGSLYMERACLGFKTILLFASIIYLTSVNNITRWSYIIIGIVFLNIINIIRIVLIFFHVQKHGSYQLTMDVHDMYTYITYVIVFILWIVWFEYFTDINIISKKLTKDNKVQCK